MSNMIENSLENHFLIAMPQLKDSMFGDTISIVCQHSADGAIAFVINKTLPQTLADIFAQMELPVNRLEHPDKPILFGGPVQPEAGFVLHAEKGKWQSTLAVNESLFITSSKDILEAISEGQGPQHYLFILGYAGWSSGQIEQELEQNSWLHSPVESEILFNTPPELISEIVIDKLGVDPARISQQIGHA